VKLCYFLEAVFSAHRLKNMRLTRGFISVVLTNQGYAEAGTEMAKKEGNTAPSGRTSPSLRCSLRLDERIAL
jgi:hypothetical protein